MVFEYEGTFYVDEYDLETMKKEVRAGKNPEEVYDEWSCALDDTDYYIVDHVRDQILEYITKGANPNA